MGAIAGRLAIIREGHGEAGAVENLVSRVGKSLGVMPEVFWSIPQSPRFVVSSPDRAVRATEIAATLSPSAVLLTADLEDLCPAKSAPEFARAIRDTGFPFPVALVFFYREYETLAISIADTLGGRELKSMNGKPIVTLSTPEKVPANPEEPRDAKGWVQRNLMNGSSYKPTVHQLPLTRALKIEDLRASGLSSYVRLEAALMFLAGQVLTNSRGVYPS